MLRVRVKILYNCILLLLLLRIQVHQKLILQNADNDKTISEEKTIHKEQLSCDFDHATRTTFTQ
jgi:hypothetical protein